MLGLVEVGRGISLIYDILMDLHYYYDTKITPFR